MKQSKLNPEKAFFMILIFAVAGFTIIMNGILSTSADDNQLNNSTYLISIELEQKAREQVEMSNIFQDYSDGHLILDSKKNLGCLDCWEFTYRFNAENLDDSLQRIIGFSYNIIIMNGEFRLTEVHELIRI